MIDLDEHSGLLAVRETILVHELLGMIYRMSRRVDAVLYPQTEAVSAFLMQWPWQRTIEAKGLSARSRKQLPYNGERDNPPQQNYHDRLATE